MSYDVPTDKDLNEEWYKGFEAGKANGIMDCIDKMESLRPLLAESKYDGGYDCCGCSTLGNLYGDIKVKLQALLNEIVLKGETNG